MNFYFYPPPYPKSRSVNYNPYTDFFRTHLSQKSNVVNCSEANSALDDLFKHITKFDVIIFNWIENIGNKSFGTLQFLLFLFLFLVLRIRKVKIVWVMHNIHPHEGESTISNVIKKLMYRYADLIIAHSREALFYGEKFAKNKVVFIHHPVDNNLFTKSVVQVTQNDIFIWGSIEPYKGILEFVQYLVDKQTSLRVKIIGKCKNDNYRNQIYTAIENFHSISFEDRRTARDELELFVHNSSYVVFPYVSNSVSSSGALMDTLAMGGNVIGPNKGAFKDLGVECLCFTFNTYDDIIRHVESNSKVDSGRIHQFVKENNWSAFVNNVFEIIIAL